MLVVVMVMQENGNSKSLYWLTAGEIKVKRKFTLIYKLAKL